MLSAKQQYSYLAFFAHCHIANTLQQAKKQVAAHGGGLFGVQKRRYAL